MKLLVAFLSTVMTLSFSTAYAKAGDKNKCNYDQVSAENESIKKNPYWQQQVKNLMKKLNENYQGCSDRKEIRAGLDIVSDDIEFVGTDEARMFSQSLNFNECNKSKSEQFNVYPNNEKFKAGTTKVYVTTPQGSLNFDANTCSPKEAIAHFITQSEAVFTQRCAGENPGTPRIQDSQLQADAKKVLAGEFGTSSGTKAKQNESK